MKNYTSVIAITLLLNLICFTSCVEDNSFVTPEINIKNTDIKATISIKALLASYKDSPIHFTEDVIVSGYVVSNDKAGNIYKSLVIQDKPENSSAGLTISVDQSELFASYEVGRKVFVKLKGLVLLKSNELPTIGAGISEKYATRLTSSMVKKAIIRGTEIKEIKPKNVLIGELNESHINQLITINKAQFINEDLGLFYANPQNNNSGNRTIIGCEDSKKLAVRNSGYSSFKGVKLPEGSGQITGILSRYGDRIQLLIRDTNDVQFDTPRCQPSFIDVTLQTNTTIKIIKEKYSRKITEINQNLIFEGYVTSSDEQENLYKVLYIQDKPQNPEHGIQILINKPELYQDFPIGRKVYIKAKGLYLDKLNGVLTLGGLDKLKLAKIPAQNIKNHIVGSNITSIVPKEVTINDIMNNSNLVSTLVKINNVQLIEQELGSAYGTPNSTYGANRTLKECSTENTIILRNSGYSTFKDYEFPTGRGSIIALVSKYNKDVQLFIRSTNDINFTEERCKSVEPLLKEDFESVAKNQIVSLEGWTNYAESGENKWTGYSDSYSLGTSVRINASKSKVESNISWLISPQIDLDQQDKETLSFKTSNKYPDDSTLEALISTNWDGTIENFSAATWEVLPAKIVSNDTNYKSWEESGNISLSKYNGKAHIAFKYSGGKKTSKNGTYELDDILIQAK